MTAILDLDKKVLGEKYLLSSGKAAKFLDVSEQTFASLRKLIPFVLLPGCKHPRFRIADLIEFVMQCREDPQKALPRADQKEITVVAGKDLEIEKEKNKNIPASRPVK